MFRVRIFCFVFYQVDTELVCEFSFECSPFFLCKIREVINSSHFYLVHRSAPGVCEECGCCGYAFSGDFECGGEGFHGLACVRSGFVARALLLLPP